jgi:hypothetical protein
VTDGTEFTVKAGWCPICRGRCFADHQHAMADIGSAQCGYSHAALEARGRSEERARIRRELEEWDWGTEGVSDMIARVCPESAE